MSTEATDSAREALERLYADALEIYEQARTEVTIPRSDGTRQKYAPVRYKQQIERAYQNNELVPAIARTIKQTTIGFGHLEAAGRPDLMLETLVLDKEKPYHRLFDPKTVRIAERRMAEHAARHAEEGT
ncbi:MAG: hypothetical protein M3540_03975 [Actinomycetota bacterium]|nr:hypothetical protein [Actinomycetota bacterium]